MHKAVINYLLLVAVLLLQHWTANAAEHKSHDTAYNSIISNYYVTDPFFGLVKTEEGLENRRAGSTTQDNIPAPLLVGGEKAQPRHHGEHAVLPEDKIPAPLLVGGTGQKPKGERSAPVRMHIKKKKQPVPHSPVKVKKVLRTKPVAIKRPAKRQVFSQLLGEELPEAEERPRQQRRQKRPSPPNGKMSKKARKEAYKASASDPHRKGMFRSDFRGDIPTLPYIEEGAELSQSGHPASNAVFPGDPGAPPRKTYFDIMEGFFDKPEINIFPRNPPPSSLPPPATPSPPPFEPSPRLYPQPFAKPIFADVPESLPGVLAQTQPNFEPLQPHFDHEVRVPAPEPTPAAPTRPRPHFRRPLPIRPGQLDEQTLQDIQDFESFKEGFPPKYPEDSEEQIYSTPKYHPYADPLNHRNPLDISHQAEQVELYLQPPLTRQKDAENLRYARPPPLGVVDVPKVGHEDKYLEAPFTQPYTPPVREDTHASYPDLLTSNDVFGPIPFANLEISGTLLPQEHRSAPPLQEPRPPPVQVQPLPGDFQSLSSTGPGDRFPVSGHFNEELSYDAPKVRGPRRPPPPPPPPPRSTRTKKSNFPTDYLDVPIPHLPPPPEMILATRNFPIDVPRLGAKVPYEPLELLVDAFHDRVSDSSEEELTANTKQQQQQEPLTNYRRPREPELFAPNFDFEAFMREKPDQLHALKSPEVQEKILLSTSPPSEVHTDFSRAVAEPVSGGEDVVLPDPEDFFRGLERPRNFGGGASFPSPLPVAERAESPYPGQQPQVADSADFMKRRSDPQPRPQPQPPHYHQQGPPLMNADTTEKTGPPVYLPTDEYVHEPVGRHSREVDEPRHKNHHSFQQLQGEKMPSFGQWESDGLDEVIVEKREAVEDEEEVNGLRPSEQFFHDDHFLEGNPDAIVSGRSSSYHDSDYVENPHQFVHVGGHHQFHAGHNRGHPDHHVQDVQEHDGHAHRQEVSA